MIIEIIIIFLDKFFIIKILSLINKFNRFSNLYNFNSFNVFCMKCHGDKLLVKIFINKENLRIVLS